MNLDNAIRSFLSHGDIDVTASGTYARMQRIVLAQIAELRLNVSPDVRSAVLVINDDLTVDMPADSVRIYKVGRLMPDGSVRTFGESERFYEENTCDCPGCSAVGSGGQQPAGTSRHCHFSTFHNVFWDGRYGELYGLRDDYFENGKWSVNGNKITFHSGYDVRAGNKVVVEYETSTDGFSVIPEEDIEMLRNKCLHEFFLNMRPSVADRYFVKFKQAINNKVRRETRMPPEWWIANFSGHKNVPQ